MHHNARAHNARIIKYEHCALRQILRNIAKVALGDSAVVVDKQLRRRTLRQWKLGDALIGKVIVKVVNIYISFHYIKIGDINGI